MIRNRMSALSVLSAVLALSFLASPNTQAGLILDLNTGGAPTPKGLPGVDTFGWAFSVNSAITVDGLGIWDTNADGIGSAQSVGLWTNSGTLLASAVVQNSSTQVASASADGNWLFETIAALLLTPGDYVVGSTFSETEPFAQIGAPFVTIPEVTLLEGRQGTGGFSFPGTTFSAPIFGPTLRTQDVQAVPEPGSFSLFLLGGIGLAGLMFNRRRRRQTV